MLLDEEFVAEGLAKAEFSLYEGISINEYSRDELIAIAVELGNMYLQSIEQSRSSMNLMRDLHNMKDRMRYV